MIETALRLFDLAALGEMIDSPEAADAECPFFALHAVGARPVAIKRPPRPAAPC